MYKHLTPQEIEEFEKEFPGLSGIKVTPHRGADFEKAKLLQKYYDSMEERLLSFIDTLIGKRVGEIVEKIEEIELSCVDDRLLGKTDEYLEGYNTSTERWRVKRDDLLTSLSPDSPKRNEE